jgi:hypothetical protein
MSIPSNEAMMSLLPLTPRSASRFLKLLGHRSRTTVLRHRTYAEVAREPDSETSEEELEVEYKDEEEFDPALVVGLKDLSVTSDDFIPGAVAEAALEELEGEEEEEEEEYAAIPSPPQLKRSL